MAPIWGAGVVFAIATCWLYWLSTNPPNSDLVSIASGETKPDPTMNGTPLPNRTEMSFPTNLEELTSLAAILQHYQAAHGGYVLLLFCSAYLYKQTFAIPGSVFLNILAGALFGMWLSLPLVCLLSAIGATFCYLISYNFGYSYVQQCFPDKIKILQQKIHENSDSLFFFLLFVRLFPMTPNWFLNLASPVLDVPVLQFFLSVLIGLLPYNLICIQTGCILSQIKSIDSIFNTWTLCKLGAAAVAMLLPGVIVKKYRHKLEKIKLS
ncbi:transmembrane protein 41A-like [Ptychodera flava]|uniref:transmembrane protein 41A-like n=1 Tax=Ptychodera flava TaxID=63121 RepID=UPI003969D617